MEKLISVAVMRDSDASEIASGTDSKILMYRAGLGIFRSFDWHGRIDIVTGSGNNAGDGYVLALLLGLLLSRLGILGKNELSASKSEGFVFFLLMAVVLAGFSTTTPQMFTQMLPPLLLILLTDLAAITLLEVKQYIRRLPGKRFTLGEKR